MKPPDAPAGTPRAADPGDRPALVVDRVTKLYRRVTPGDQLRTLKSALLDGSLTRKLHRDQAIAALEEVSFEVGRGEAFGVVGGNGSGKSTLLKVVAGILQPSSGEVIADGRVAALIELGAGFHPEISGRENIYINGAVLGLERREIDRRFDAIVEFSGLADFIDEPVKNYSSGMYVRLGFAVAIHTDPDILLVDEVLAVGDEAFAHRCLRRIEEFLAAGKTLLFVSHSLDLVEDLCDRVLWLDRGVPRLVGPPRRVIDAYRQAVAEEEGREHQQELAARTAEAGEGDGEEGGGEEDGGDREPSRWGSREALVTGVRMLVGPERTERYHLESGEAVTFELTAEARQPLEDFVFGVAVSTPRGVECWGTNTDLADLRSDRFEGRGRVELTCPALRLGPGEYGVDVAIHSREGSPYDYRKRMFSFTVTARDRGIGVYFPEHRWQASGGIRWHRQEETPAADPGGEPGPGGR